VADLRNPGRFPWLATPGTAGGWLVIDRDATLITARSDKEAPPDVQVRVWLPSIGGLMVNTAESLAMLLRPATPSPGHPPC
jgi:hypothetical protein